MNKTQFFLFVFLFLSVVLLTPSFVSACWVDGDCGPDQTCQFGPDAGVDDPGICVDNTPPCDPAAGTACSPANACDATNTGVIQCDGTCSVSAPANPAGLGDSCESPENACGDTTSGSLVCDGTTGTKCSATSPPAEPAPFGEPCTKSNACNITSGTYQCDGSCSASDPAPIPPGFGNSCNCNNVGECGGTIQCNGLCSGTTPTDKTLAVTSVSASPSSGAAPLNGVAVTVSIAGTATGDIEYKLDCTNDGTFEQTISSISSPYTFDTKCSYPSAGTYTAAAHAKRQTLTASGTATITVTSPDTTAPTLAQVTAVPSPTNDTTPNYTFSSTEAGTIAYGGDCSSATTAATIDNNTVTFNALAQGVHTLCTISVTDASANKSADLIVNTFMVDTTAPTLAQVTAVPSPTNDTTPNYTFSSTEAGTIAYGGDCSSATTAASSGNNTVTFNALAQGVHTLCTISVTDASANKSADLIVNTFMVDTTVPTTIFTDPATTPAGVTPAAGSLQDSTFTVSVSDADNPAGSGLSTCHYGVYSDPAGWTVPLGTARTCNSNLSITVGPAGDCRNTGTNKCQVQVYSRDVAGNSSPIAMRAYSIAFLTYPAGTWQRLWYSTSGASPTFSTGNFLGETPNETSATFSTDWGAGVLAYTRVDSIGFKSSRTINFPTAGTYRFTIGSDDGARLFVDGVNQVDQWADGGYRTKFKDIALSAGDHTFEFDFYENGGSAMGSFDYIPTPCQKVAVPPASNLLQDPSSLTIPLPTGDRVCSLTIAHLGSDNTDGSAVAFESLSNPANANYIGMDDNTASGCENNLKFHNVWDTVAGAHNFNVSSAIDTPFSAGNALGYGFTLSTDCAIKNLAGLCSGAGNYCPIGAKAADDRSFTVTGQKSNKADTDVNLAGLKNNLTTDGFAFQFNIVECTQNSHCTADPTKAKCNIDADNNGVGDITSNFNPNTCIDSVAPTSKITTVDTYDAVEDVYKKPGVRLNYPFADQSSAFLRADDEGNTKRTWWMYVVDADTGSGLNTCSISINGITKPDRSCAAGWLTFTVGLPVTGADCQLDGDDRCTVKVWARDNAGNITSTKNVNTITSKEKDYIDGAVVQDASEFTFSVDWHKPTAH